MTPQTCLLLIIPLVFLSAAATAQNYGCFGGNYTGNSTYSTNLNSLISSLPQNLNDTGFYSAAAGQSPDVAYATALCRTDIQLAPCRTCIQEAAPELLGSLCPNRRQGILFKETCTLRYSDEPLSGGAGAESYAIFVWSGLTVRMADQFNSMLRELLKGLRDRAAKGGPLVKAAAGEQPRAPDFQSIFALVQCAPDMSEMGCAACLVASQQSICCSNATGMTIYKPGCFLQYGVVPFYNITRIEEVRAMVSPAPPPPVPAPAIPSSPGSNDIATTRTVIIILLPIVVSLVIAAWVGNYMRKRLKKKTVFVILENDKKDLSVEESILFDFKDLVAATDNFSNRNKLGEGGFGVVYKGKLQSGQYIAVKRLSRNSGQGELEFKNEVVLMVKLQHRNLVRLLGFSIQGTERLLVYEFVKNGSLDRVIFDPVKRLLINWESRYKIIKGIAKGLVYLHEGSALRIIHRDLKASNILIDRDNNPKISDFGMARLCAIDETRANTFRIVGTYGYMPPEYARNGIFSIKSDVFSFGVLVLEIISGQSNSSFKNVENGESVEYMLSFAWRNWCAGRAKKMIDPALVSADSACLHDILRCIHIGLLCVQENASDRPTMDSVVVMLSSFTVTLPVPTQPAFFVPRRVHKLNSSLEIKSTQFSKNEASITQLYPR